MAKQYVQHVSGQGEKWKLFGELNQQTGKAWSVLEYIDDQTCKTFNLPKSEFALCDPPEVWRDVTGDIDPQDKSDGCCIAYDGFTPIAWTTKGYKFRKVSCAIEGEPGFLTRKRAAFVFEKKEPRP